jgi:hypothetical protein
MGFVPTSEITLRADDHWHDIGHGYWRGIVAEFKTETVVKKRE